MTLYSDAADNIPRFRERTMKKKIFVLLATPLCAHIALAAVPGDVTKTIHQFIDAFNAGDSKAVSAAYAPGDITIVDEFAPHRWAGPHAAQEWSAA